MNHIYYDEKHQKLIDEAEDVLTKYENNIINVLRKYDMSEEEICKELRINPTRKEMIKLIAELRSKATKFKMILNEEDLKNWVS